ncbi:MAG: Ldh family oxidoreductase, partial [Alphaproteobacteria bacterium]|nr:Ldh family oxidoreductase [Alphaproteobacteria bacterium]
FKQPRQPLRVLRETEVSALYDGGNNNGMIALYHVAKATIEKAKAHGIALVGVTNTWMSGRNAYFVEMIAKEGYAAIHTASSGGAVAPLGGIKPILGTNPIAFAIPAPDGPPLVIDLALSQVARGKIVTAAREGRAIPPDWAVDAEGRPTTDPQAALGGAMVAMGGAKGAALAVMVEVLAGALAGGAFGWEASSFLDDKGGPPGVGQVLLAIDPGAFGGARVVERVGVLLAEMEAEDGVRPPGQSRLAARRRAQAEGLAVSDALLTEIKALAGR